MYTGLLTRCNFANLFYGIVAGGHNSGKRFWLESVLMDHKAIFGYPGSTSNLIFYTPCRPKPAPVTTEGFRASYYPRTLVELEQAMKCLEMFPGDYDYIIIDALEEDDTKDEEIVNWTLANLFTKEAMLKKRVLFFVTRTLDSSLIVNLMKKCMNMVIFEIETLQVEFFAEALYPDNQQLVVDAFEAATSHLYGYLSIDHLVDKDGKKMGRSLPILTNSIFMKPGVEEYSEDKTTRVENKFEVFNEDDPCDT